MDQGNPQGGKAPSLIRVFGSVIASMFGVQSSKQHEEDFTYGKPSQYILVGLFATTVFVLAIWGVVTLVMRLSGA
jgi:hypothetical protein